MLEKHKLEKILKTKIKLNETQEAIDILDDEIKEIFIAKIHMHNSSFNYTSIINLAKNVERYLNDKEISLFKKYYMLKNEESHPLYELECLINIYNKLDEGR